MERFINSPNLPENPISLAVVDGRITYEIEKKFFDLNIKIIKTTKNKYLYDAISYHPDVVMHHLGNKEILAAPNIDEKLVYALEDNGFKISYGERNIEKKYPFDIPYNVARFGNNAVCCIKYTDEILIGELYKRGINIIDVKQGYSKCSICIVSDNAVITSDSGIHNTLMKNLIDCLLITPGNINLFEMNYGFIGGASGAISRDSIAFFGDLGFHPNNIEIQKYLSKYNRKVENLCKIALTDFGTLIPLKEYSILTI